MTDIPQVRVRSIASGVVQSDSDAVERILVAARDYFEQVGMQRTRMGDIATRARISRAQLYRYFPTKEALHATLQAEEAEKLSVEFLAELPFEGPSQVVVVERIIRGLQRAQGRRMIVRLMNAENVRRSAALLSGDKVVSAEAVFWRPLIEYGQARGELRLDVPIPTMIRWILFVQFTLLEHREILATEESVREYLVTFLLPSLTAHGQPC